MLLPVARLVRVRRPVFPWPSPSPGGSNHITSSIASCSLALLWPFSRCIRPRLSPHSLRENQLHQLDKGLAYTGPAVYPSAQTETRPSPAGQRTAIISREAGSQQPSPSSQKAAQACQGTSSCHLTVKSLVHLLTFWPVSHTHTRQVFLGRVRKNPEQRLRHGRPSQARSPPTGRAKSFQYLDLGVREGRLGDFRQISISLCLCSASQSGPWRLLKHTHIVSLTHTHTACRTLFCCNSTCCKSVSPMRPCVSRPASVARHFSSSCAAYIYCGLCMYTCIYARTSTHTHVPLSHLTSHAPPCPHPMSHVHVPPIPMPPPHIHPWHMHLDKTPSHSGRPLIHSPTDPPTHSPTSGRVTRSRASLYPLALRLSCLLSRGLHIELTLRHLLAHA